MGNGSLEQGEQAFQTATNAWLHRTSLTGIITYLGGSLWLWNMPSRNCSYFNGLTVFIAVFLVQKIGDFSGLLKKFIFCFPISHVSEVHFLFSFEVLAIMKICTCESLLDHFSTCGTDNCCSEFDIKPLMMRGLKWTILRQRKSFFQPFEDRWLSNVLHLQGHLIIKDSNLCLHQMAHISFQSFCTDYLLASSTYLVKDLSNELKSIR